MRACGPNRGLGWKDPSIRGGRLRKKERLPTSPLNRFDKWGYGHSRTYARESVPDVTMQADRHVPRQPRARNGPAKDLAGPNLTYNFLDQLTQTTYTVLPAVAPLNTAVQAVGAVATPPLAG